MLFYLEEMVRYGEAFPSMLTAIKRRAATKLKAKNDRTDDKDELMARRIGLVAMRRWQAPDTTLPRMFTTIQEVKDESSQESVEMTGDRRVVLSRSKQWRADRRDA